MLLLRSWRWRTMLYCEMPISPDTLQVLLAGFAKVVKMTNHTGLWDAELVWYSPNATHWICRGRESDKSYRIMRYRARLILSECYTSDLPQQLGVGTQNTTVFGISDLDRSSRYLHLLTVLGSTIPSAFLQQIVFATLEGFWHSSNS